MLDNGSPVPFYEYRRPDGTTLEVMQKMSDPPLSEDPETGVALERIFHPIAVHFKGKGFYNTDYGTKNRQREKAAEEGSKSESGSGDGKSSETKTSGDSGASSSGDSGSSSSGDSGSSSSGESGASSSGDSGSSSSKSTTTKSSSTKSSPD